MATKKIADIDGLIAQLEPYFTKQAPFQLPDGLKDWIIEYAWLVTLVVALLSLPGAMALLGLLGIVGAWAPLMGVVVGPWYWLAGVALVVQLVLMFVSVPGLKVRSYEKGWKIVFYGVLFSAASSVLRLTVSSLLGAAIGLAIGLYVLYQVKRGFR